MMDRLIHSPPRSGWSGIITILASALLLTVVSFSGRAGAGVVALSLLLVVLSLLTREVQAFHLTWFTAVFVTAPYLFPPLHGWPFLLLVPLLCYCFLAFTVPSLRSTIGYVHIGRFDRGVKLLALCFVFVPGIALVFWYRTIGPDLSVHLAHFPVMPIWMLPLAGLGFALGNAAVEEFAYRGIILQALESAAGPGLLSLLVQAWLFGALHYREGFPNGAWGLAMTAVYGIMLGVLRRRSQGMLAPWVVHVFADFVIFTILAGNVLQSTG
jgi:membrane protease YdiL (CAAX protease family)